MAGRSERRRPGAVERLLPRAEECGVVPGLASLGGLGRTAEGALRIVEAIKSPWLQTTLDTGNFLEWPYERREAMAPREMPIALVQAQAYSSRRAAGRAGPRFARIAAILRARSYRGRVSLEFERTEDAVPGSLAPLREVLS